MQQFSQPEKAIICDVLRELIKESGIQGLKFAAAADISYRTLYSIIQGDSQRSDRTLWKIARALGTTPAEILTVRAEKPGSSDMSMIKPGRSSMETIQNLHDDNSDIKLDKNAGHVVRETSSRFGKSPDPAQLAELRRQFRETFPQLANEQITYGKLGLADLAKLIADTLGIDQTIAFDHVHQMVQEKKEGRR